MAIVLVLIILGALSKKKDVSTSVTKNTAENTTTKKEPTLAVKDTWPVDPVIGDSQFFTDAKWDDPSVLKTSSGFVMYASAGKGFSGDIDIYRLESKDGVTWELNPKNAVLENSTNADAVDKKGVETPSVVLFNGTYHMFYTAYPKDLMDWHGYRIMHATSLDGITWTKDPNPIAPPTDPLNTTPNMDFNQWIVAEPGAVIFKDKIYLYFAASGANVVTQSDLFTIGLTTSSDGKTWSKPRQVLVPDQSMYPRKKYQGYSTPAATVHNGKVELFFDVAEANPFHQVAFHRAVSSDGETDWKVDPTPIITTKTYTWAADQVISPSPLYVEDKLYMWFAGHTNYKLGIGLYVK